MTQREKMIELITEYHRKIWKHGENWCVGCADHLLANGVIVPPCKVGDTVYFLNTYSSIAMRKNFVYEAKVVRVYVEKDNILCLSIQIKNEYGTTEYPRITEIGKTVFLSREDAGQALAERSNP